VVALALAGPAVLFGGVAWADDPTPAPVDDSATEAPVVQPSVGSWIIGGTELEGTAGTPAKPAAKPAAATTTHTTTSHRTTSSSSGGAHVLPFTGNHVDALLPTGVALLVGGVVLTLAGRPRRVIA
jgi:hypothetical protein